MGVRCSKFPMEEDEKRDKKGAFVPVEGFDSSLEGLDASSLSPTTPNSSSAGSKRSREGRLSGSFRRSIFRVGSRAERRKLGRRRSSPAPPPPLDDVPGSPRARASTYSHVHDAVMYNLSEAERSKHDRSVPMGVTGLRNMGNTCFINSSLQCLSATIPLTDYFLGYDYRSEINRDNFLGTGGKLVSSYAELMKQMWLGKKSVVQPSDFKKQIGTFAPQFSGFRQHDSQELLSFLLDGIHEDLNRVKERPYIEDNDCDGTRDEEDAIDAWKNYLRRNKSLVVDLFQGQLKSTCKCLTCGHTNIRFEPFMYLSLPISDKTRSLDACIDLYLKEETLSGTDQWYCEKCKKHVDATKKTDIWILPPILIVHLKRFRYNDYGKAGSKNDAPVAYPVKQWDLKPLVKSQAGVYPMYDLYAVSNHIGGLGGGHYTALALNRFDDRWYEFNDSTYREVEESKHKNYTRSSYVLFYNRSEGDANMPLNERSPIIRRQSVSRPDLWPHTQVGDRKTVRDFTRSSRRLSEALPVEVVRELTSTRGSKSADDDMAAQQRRKKESNPRSPPGKPCDDGRTGGDVGVVDGTQQPAKGSQPSFGRNRPRQAIAVKTKGRGQRQGSDGAKPTKTEPKGSSRGGGARR